MSAVTTMEARQRHPRCSRTGKAKFATYDKALKELARIAAKPMDGTVRDHYRPCAVISCSSCDGFHLTSKSPKPWTRAGRGTAARQHGKRRGKARRRK